MPAAHPFTDDVSGRPCELVIPPGGSVFPAPGQPKTGVRHPDCPAVADLCMELDAFWCPDCKWNGRISGAWAADLIEASRGWTFRPPADRIEVSYCTEFCGDACTCSLAAEYRQSATACCPRQTIPDSCSCLEGCGCMCLDCDCDSWGEEYDDD